MAETKILTVSDGIFATSAKDKSISLPTRTATSKPMLTYPQISPPHSWWIDFDGSLVKEMKWRDDDIVISVPGKSGTTWSMNIVHQLRSGKGDPQVRDIYEQVPWLDFWEYPSQSVEELHHKWAALPTWYPRAFKTHHSPRVIPFQTNVKYIVVIRDPRDAAESFFPFLNAHTKELQDAWDVNIEVKTMEETWNHLAVQKGQPFIDFLQAWWPYRQSPNVLMLHYTDMVKDHKGAIKKFQNFLNFDEDKNNLINKNFKKICEYTSFEWMKKNGEKFAIRHLLRVPGLLPDGMVRKGAIGEGKKHLSKEILESFDSELSRQLTPEQKNWFLFGGPLPLLDNRPLPFLDNTEK